jgi:pancreatic triacylglycerol lipase
LEVKFPSNIIGVDWEKLATPHPPASSFYYPLAAKNVLVVGERVADFLLFLLRINAVTSTDSMHVVGFSLGAHVAGIAGHRIIQSGISPLQRITGLDPASPLFQDKPKEGKLDSTDALFVDVVHTNQGFKGYVGLLGHVDFFPNGGGPFQPGCSNLTDFSDVFTG